MDRLRARFSNKPDERAGKSCHCFGDKTNSQDMLNARQYQETCETINKDIIFSKRFGNSKLEIRNGAFSLG
jgi:hypothetical protein